MRRKESEFQLEVVSVRLVKDAPLYSSYPIRFPEDAVNLLGDQMCELDREVICVLHLKTDGVPINCTFASVGALNEAIAHPRELLKASILSNASSIVLLHNHPSGQLIPSEQDAALTDRLATVCMHIGIALLDHIIVGGDNTHYFSFLEKGILPTPRIEYEKDYKKISLPTLRVAEKGRRR